MALSFMPCADISNRKSSHNHSEASAHQQNHDHSETTDSCTPFCSCSCCGAILYHLNGINRYEEIKTDLFSKPNPQYIPVFIPRYFGDIWQPPKINA